MIKEINDMSFFSRTFESGTIFNKDYNSCEFSGSSFKSVKFSGTFIDCDFSSVNINGCMFVGAVFKNCCFTQSVITNSCFISCVFRKCEFSQASIRNAGNLDTCVFSKDCTELLSIDSDMTVYEVLEGGVLTYRFRRKVPMPPLKDHVTMVPPLPYKYNRKPLPDNTMQKKLLVGSEDTLVDPEQLPEVDYYRSSPCKISKDDKPEVETSVDEFDEEDYYTYRYGGYTMGSSNSYFANRKEKYRYGYMENAVLLCSDIEEYMSCRT